MRRILLAYAVPKSGHASAARAIAQALQASSEDCTVSEHHFLIWHRHLLRFLPAIYAGFVRHLPSIWRHIHGNLDYSRLLSMVVILALYTGWFGLKKRLRLERYDVIVATHFLFVQLLGEARRRGLLSIPVYTLVTDYGAHPFWAHPGIDRYFLPGDTAADDLARAGVSRDRLCVTGMPVKEEVVQRISRTEACGLLGLDPDRSVVLVVGGSYGFFPFIEVLKSVSRGSGNGDYWLFLTGTNTKAYAALKDALPAAEVSRLRIYDFQANLAPFFSVADIALTKPGGLFSTEALVAGIPLVFHNPLPGQEEENARYVCSHGAAVLAYTTDEAVRQIGAILSDVDHKRALQEAEKRLARPQAAQDIVKELFASVSL